jgi:hypothetical protein
MVDSIDMLTAPELRMLMRQLVKESGEHMGMIAALRAERDRIADELYREVRRLGAELLDADNERLTALQERDALLDAVNRADAALNDESLEDYGQNAAACVALAAVYDAPGRLARARHIAALGRVAAAAEAYRAAEREPIEWVVNRDGSRSISETQAQREADAVAALDAALAARKVGG